MVVGGGPAGLEAARVAALRGHEVSLYERQHKLGGLTPLAEIVMGFEEDIAGLIRYLKIQCTKLGVKIKLGTEVDPALVNEIKPDVVILATGGIPTIPEIPGINRRNVASIPSLHHRLRSYLRFLGPKFLSWLTRLWLPIGKTIVVLGGSIHGCQLAEFLVSRGRRVTIVETSAKLGAGLSVYKKRLTLAWLAEKGVTMMADVKYEEITEKGLTITTKEGERRTIEADTVLPAMPLRPNAELAQALKANVPEFHLIGDCHEPHLISEAIADGSRTGRTI
ncbi:FAD-dependent oxidoreductase [Chloroflexota bacterium]